MLSTRKLLLILMAFGLTLGHDVEIVRAQGFGAAPKAGKQNANEKLSTKVFRLKSCDPEDVQEALDILLTQLPLEGAEDVNQPGFGETLGGGGIGGLGGGGGFGGGPGAGGLAPGGGTTIAVHKRTKSLVVRGTKRDLQIATDLIKVLESPSEQKLPEVKSLVAIQLMHADADELDELLTNLEVEVAILPLAAAKLLIVAGTLDDMKEISEVVKQLDVPEQEKTTGEPRKLFGDRDDPADE